MKQIVIFGCRDGQYLYEQLRKYQIDNIIFCDNNVDLQGTVIDGKKIVSVDDLLKLSRDNEISHIIVTVRNGYNRWKIVNQLLRNGINKNLIGLVKPSVITYRWDIVFEKNLDSDDLFSKQILWLKNVTKPLIYYLEVHASDSCNLNCKGCLHFSSLYKNDILPDIERVLSDVKRLNEKCQIFHLRILGGEPLLNPRLGELITRLRSFLPDTDIGIVTNGTLITRQNKKLFEIMKENMVGFNITLYPPTYSNKDEIYKVLNEANVSYGSHRAKIDEFSKGFSLHRQSVESCKSHEVCVSKGCLFLRNGRLYKCAPEALVNRFYEKFGIGIDTTNAGVDIYNNDIKWASLIQSLYQSPVEQCLYCSNELKAFTWGVASNPIIEDWIVD